MTFAELKRLLAKRGAMRLVPDVVEAIAGESVAGTWWAHPKGGDIYRIATKLEEASDVVVAKLPGSPRTGARFADAKVTFVHATLWPALVRIVTDAAWRSSRTKLLSTEAKRLFGKIEKNGRMPAKGPLKNELEKSGLVRGVSEHTDKGHHATMLESWSSWAPKSVLREARALSLEEAHDVLRGAKIDLS